jgi:hypothetical protein
MSGQRNSFSESHAPAERGQGGDISQRPGSTNDLFLRR